MRDEAVKSDIGNCEFGMRNWCTNSECSLPQFLMVQRALVLNVLCVLCVLGGSSFAAAQIQMPDARQMSGIPRPVDDLPARTVSVRLVRGDLSNNIANHPVELHVGGKVETVVTDEAGRAQFGPLTPGAVLKAVAVVDGERLESQEFPAPAVGGIRLLLVATDKEKEGRAAAEATALAIPGQVRIGGDSRFVIEPGEEMVRVYYLLDVVNTAGAPVNPSTPFEFTTPDDSDSTSILEGSSPQASVSGKRVRVEGPFPPGNTFVQVAYTLPATTGSVDIAQPFPVTLEHVAVIVRKVGDARLTSPQLVRQQEMPADGKLYIAAGGSQAIEAGQPMVLHITGLPHHSGAPRWVALSLAFGIVLVGVVAARRPPDPGGSGAERKRLVARREKLFQDLVRLEADHRHGKSDQSRYPARREELIAALEHIYGILDSDDSSPEPAGRAGLAA